MQEKINKNMEEYNELVEKTLPYTVGDGSPEYRISPEGEVYTPKEFSVLAEKTTADYNVVNVLPPEAQHELDTKG